MGERADQIRSQSESVPRQYDTGEMPEDPDEIRAEIEHTRADMSETVDEIGERLNPERLKQQATDTVRDATIGRAEHMIHDAGDSAREASESIMDTIKQNPIPVAMAGIGIGWLVMRGRSSSKSQPVEHLGGYDRDYGRGYTHSSEQARERAGQYAGQAQQRAGQMQEQASEYSERAREQVGQVSDQAQQRAHQVESQFQQMMRENPLAVGAIAFGLGAAVGLMIPETQKEEEMMGETRDQLLERAQETAHDTMEKVQHVAEEARSAAQEEAEQQGLSGNQ